MAQNVYPLPTGLVQSITYGPQHLVSIEEEFFGTPAQIAEVTPRITVTLEGIIHRDNHAVFWAFVNRLAGGVGLAAIVDQSMRIRQDYDADPAINSSGDEFWGPASNIGNTSTYAGEAAGAVWRSILVQAVGALSAGATSIDVDGLLSTEPVKAGTPIRIGTYRHTITANATASSGAVTLSVAPALRALVADNTDLRLPGDLGVFRLMARPDIGSADRTGVASFSMTLREVYESEITGGFTWVV